MMEFLMGFWYIYLYPVFTIIGLIAGLFLARPRHDQVLKLQSGGIRGAIFDIIEENAIFFYAKRFGNFPPQRFVKNETPCLVQRQSWFGRIVNQNFWLAREGTAYTQQMIDEKEVVKPLDEGLRTLFGEVFYNQIPKVQKDAIQSAKMNIVVKVKDAGLTPTGFKTLSEEDIKSEEDRQASKNLWNEFKATEKTNWINMTLAFATGGFLTLGALLLLNMLKTGG